MVFGLNLSCTANFSRISLELVSYWVSELMHVMFIFHYDTLPLSNLQFALMYSCLLLPCCLSALLLFERVLTGFCVSWCLGLLLIACHAPFPYESAAHVHQHGDQWSDQRSPVK